MEAIRATEARGARTLQREEFESLAPSLRDVAAFPGDEVYSEAVQIWNGMIQKRPAVVVRPAGIDDVVRTVELARETGVELSIRGGGHNIAGLALSDGGIILDMSGLRRVDVDPEARLARVGPTPRNRGFGIGSRSRSADALLLGPSPRRPVLAPPPPGRPAAGRTAEGCDG
jgi:hypothetical protein